MTDNEDLKKEIEQLKKEIENLRSEKENSVKESTVRDERILRALQWLNIGEAKAKAYIYLVRKGRATAEEVAEGAGLYPTTAREVLNGLSDAGIVEREKLNTNGAGRKPFLYTAIPPSELLKKRVYDIEQTLSELMRLEFFMKSGEIKFKAPLLPIKIEIKGINKENKDQENQE